MKITERQIVKRIVQEHGFSARRLTFTPDGRMTARTTGALVKLFGPDIKRIPTIVREENCKLA